jgi:uncharacterized membrane protein
LKQYNYSNKLAFDSIIMIAVNYGINLLNSDIRCWLCVFRLMAINNNAKITLVVGIIAASVFIATLTTTLQQQAYALSEYYSAAKGKTDQKLQQHGLGNTAQPSPTTPTLPTVPTANCAMDTIESLEPFISCLGAK